MNIDVNTALLVTTILVAIRLTALFLMTPLFASTQIPLNVRTIFILALALVLVLSLKIQPQNLPLSQGAFMMAAVHELLIGALMAFGLFTAFGAFLFGGRILDFQMGFGVANLIDPATNTQGPMIGTVLNLMAVATFFALDGHHLLMRGIAYSLEQLPPGGGVHRLQLDAIVLQFGRMFLFGLMLVAPAVVALLMLDVGLAVAARTMPQVNIFIVGLPLKIFVGITVLTISISYMSPLLNRIFESIFRYWEQVLA